MSRTLLEATDDEILRALALYNWPAGGGKFYTADHETNYRRGLQEAKASLGVVTMPNRVVFDRNFPATIQDDDFSCAPSSLDWALRALGRSPGHSYVENLLLKDGIVSREQGLLVATGGPLAAWIGKKVPADVYYGADGFYGNNEASITWDALIPEISPFPPYPLLLGGRNWGGSGFGHWSGVRGYDQARGVILLANPAGNGPKFGGQEMTRAQWDAKGPFSTVRVLHDDLLAVAPPVTPPPAPSRQRVLIGEIRDRLLELEALAPA